MNRIIGIVVGLVIMGISAAALRAGAEGRAQGFEDIAFWWTVVGVLLAVAALAAIIGSVTHSRRVRE